jgi:hypothetical protein
MSKTSLSIAIVLVTLSYGCSDGVSPIPPNATGGSAGAPGGGAAAGVPAGGSGNSMAGMPGGSGAGAGAGTGGLANPGGGNGGEPGGAGMSGSGGSGGPIVPVGETPEAKWVNITNNLAGMPSECGNLGMVSSHPYKDMLIVGVALKGLFGSDDGGANWKPLGATGAMITNRISYVAYDPTSADVFWESGIYNGGGVYKTTDSGATFTQVGNVTHCDSVSLDFGDPARKTLLAGSHEQSQKLFRSIDGGTSWEDIGKKLPDGTGFCTISTILDSKTFVVGCGGWYGGTPGIYRSTDGGDSFQPVSDKGVAGQPLRAKDGNLYWAGHQAGGLYRSTDQGKTFTQVADSNQAKSAEPIELPDGRIVTVGGQTLMISANKGDSWEPIGDMLPFAASGVSYSPYRNAFYVWHWDCGTAVLADAISRFGFDYRK